MDAPAQRRRRRPAVSCTLCRQRKIRCNKETPCSNCVRSKTGSCVYNNPETPLPRRSHVTPRPAPRNHVASSSPSAGSSSIGIANSAPTNDVDETTSASSVACDSGIGGKSAARQRPQPPVEGPKSTIQTTSTHIGGTFHIEADDRVANKSRGSSRNIIHKTRVFGQSHWVNGVSMVLQIPPVLELYLRQDTMDISSKLQRCKALARMIKAHRTPAWPRPPTAELPAKEVADELIDCYLRTSERVYRVVHIPSFRRDYDALWTPGETRSTAFIVQLKLILAIGATTYDEAFSLRELAMQWVYEAQTWLSEPGLKSQLSIRALQTSVLLLLARESTGVGETLVWTVAGSLLRTAIYMGLHRDPAKLPGVSPFDAEMRRRLWNTILELELQSSMASGGPPLLSLVDFDTRPPANMDDEQLEAEEPVAQPDDELTQTSLAIALRRTFAARLAVLKFLNDASSPGTYTEALRLDAELRDVYKTLRRTLRGYDLDNASPNVSFESRYIDILLLRYLSAIHTPFFGPSLHDVAEYAFSRRVVIDSALKIWSAACLSETTAATRSTSQAAPSPGGQDMARFVTNGSGFFRTTVFQAGTLAALELRAQLQEDAPGPTLVRSDLLAALRECKAWSLRCIEVGETNIKGYLLVSLLAAQVNCYLATGDEAVAECDVPMRLVEAAAEIEDECLALLEAMVAPGEAAAHGGCGVHDASSSATPSMDLMSEWDSLMTDDPLLGSNSGFQFGWSV
ncbi:C6 transcription factor [Purpureocillium lilacinum]|uniref:C6 transcription factor n=1 Tax=Purpureocillium lilacinum TaxID=33203 RepID=A0A179GVG3_PURLI|nr:C6 transcription factor [Purpureocillium lilacinum]OAQ81293.1 C6 transcription factor [Purpureocillium lilacinum]